jgi:prepilin-type processing-associated H-X9-DG protein
MSQLTPQQIQQVMDFFFQCGEEDELDRGRFLIQTNPEAARLYAFLEETLGGMDVLEEAECPDDLAALTIARLKLAARVQQATSSERLGELLEHESRKTLPIDSSSSLSPVSIESKPHWGKRVFEAAAMAAAIVMISGLLLPAVSEVRNHSRQVACSVNLGRIGRALSAYADENDGRFAAAHLQPGQPWWMVGDQSEQPRSSTRYVWQLVRLGYVSGENFVCPGHREGTPVQCNSDQFSQLRDFPSPSNISYSVMLRCRTNSPTLGSGQRRIILSDMNPVFVSFRKRSNCMSGRDDYEKVLLNEHLKQLLSPNHNQRGQNVLFCDGSVEFLTSRFYQEDDIFTVRGVETYTGREVPADEQDIFLVP